MSLKLYDYQIDAISRMKNGCILCGGVGSGKSRTAIGYYFKLNGGDFKDCKYVPMKSNPKDLYIITTAKKRDSKEWELDLAPFLLYPDSPEKYYDHNIIIDSWNNIKNYIDVKDAFFIFDEQRVTGKESYKDPHKGMWVKSFWQIAKNNEWILLTATPGDKWEDYVPLFVANGFYRDRSEFNDEHIIWDRWKKYPKVSRYLNTKKLERLRNSILIDMDFERHTVQHHEDVLCNYDIFVYKELAKQRWNPFDDEPILNASELCYLQRKVANSSDDRQVKLLEILEKHSKAIIFYNFDYELDILRGLFINTEINFAEWNGHKHELLPTNNAWVYLVQYTAGSEGWNCITTDTIIFFSQTYSYRTLIQACGRTDRRNTPFKDLYYYHLKSHAPIDIAISRALSQKKDFNERKYCDKMFNNLKGEKKND